MSFKIECVPGLEKRMSKLSSGLEFFRHPESAYQTHGQTATQTATSASTRSPGRSTKSSSPATPRDSSDRALPGPSIHPRQLSRRLSQFQLGSLVPPVFTKDGSPSPSSYLEKILDINPDDDSHHVQTSQEMNPTELMETVSEESPFQTWQLIDPNPVASSSAFKPSSSMQTVRVTKFVTSGYLWDYWLAEHSQYGSVILKLVYIPNYACDEPNTWEYVAPDQVLNEALKEEMFYLGPLSDLQGQLVPRYYGLYHTVPDDYHYAILLEYADVSAPVTHDLDWREKLYKAYDTLHLRGVWHGNLSSRHILTDSHNQIRLVGFRRASKLDLTKEDDVEKLMVEALEVREHIGLEVREEVKMSILSPSYYAKLNEHDRKHLVDSFPLRSHNPIPIPLTGYAKMISELFPPPAIDTSEVRFQGYVYPSPWTSGPRSPVLQGNEVAENQAEEKVEENGGEGKDVISWAIDDYIFIDTV